MKPDGCLAKVAGKPDRASAYEVLSRKIQKKTETRGGIIEMNSTAEEVTRVRRVAGKISKRI
jgi:hypothetical protein